MMETKVEVHHGQTKVTIDWTGHVKKVGRAKWKNVAKTFWKCIKSLPGHAQDGTVNIAIEKPGQAKNVKARKAIAIIINADCTIQHVGYEPDQIAQDWWTLIIKSHPNYKEIRDGSEAKAQD